MSWYHWIGWLLLFWFIFCVGFSLGKKFEKSFAKIELVIWLIFIIVLFLWVVFASIFGDIPNTP